MTKAGCVSIPPELVPVTAITNVPAGVPLVVETVNVDVPDPLIDVGLKLAVTPVGDATTFADKVTLPVNPFPGVREIVVVPAVPPGVRFNVLGEAESVKKALAVETGARASIMPCPFGVPQPVTMSKPVMAVNEPVQQGGTDPLGLLPLVMS